MRALTTTIALALGGILLTSGANAEVIDFEGLPAGTIPITVSGNLGSGPIVVEGTNPSFAPGTNAAVIFDSNHPSGGDLDLGTPNEDFGGPGVGSGGESGSPFQNDRMLNNVLIVGEDLVDDDGDGLVDDPDDENLPGAALSFDFSAIAPVTIFSIDIVDVEQKEMAAVVELFDVGGSSLGEFELPKTGHNGAAYDVTLGPTSGVHSMVVALNGSGSVDNIVFLLDSFCGDGMVDPGEACDDGNTDNNDMCRNDCSLPFCGDGILDFGEACDDGNNDNTDFCRNNCTLPFCGDGILDLGEACDDGNNDDNDGCSASCENEELCALTVMKTATPDMIVPGPMPGCDKQNKIKPTELVFKYTGGDCAASMNNQGSKSMCSGQVDDDSAVGITAGDKKGKKTYTVTPSTVAPGGQFSLIPTGGKFDADSILTAINAGGTETNQFHTSCSQPLNVGDVFGDFTLLSFNGQSGGSNDVDYEFKVTNDGTDLVNVTVIDTNLNMIANIPLLAANTMQTFNQTAQILTTTTNTVTVSGSLASGAVCTAMDTATVTVNPPVPPGTSCADGKPGKLVLRYTGDDCSASSNTQNPGKLTCQGDPNDATPVDILVTDKLIPNDAKAKVFFTGPVGLNTVFTVDSAMGGQSKLKADTVVHVSQGGVDIALVRFHTSCSQPLAVGDQFGAFLVEGFVPAPGGGKKKK